MTNTNNNNPKRIISIKKYYTYDNNNIKVYKYKLLLLFETKTNSSYEAEKQWVRVDTILQSVIYVEIYSKILYKYKNYIKSQLNNLENNSKYYISYCKQLKLIKEIIQLLKLNANNNINIESDSSIDEYIVDINSDTIESESENSKIDLYFIKKEEFIETKNNKIEKIKINNPIIKEEPNKSKLLNKIKENNCYICKNKPKNNDNNSHRISKISSNYNFTKYKKCKINKEFINDYSNNFKQFLNYDLPKYLLNKKKVVGNYELIEKKVISEELYQIFNYLNNLINNE